MCPWVDILFLPELLECIPFCLHQLVARKAFSLAGTPNLCGMCLGQIPLWAVDNSEAMNETWKNICVLVLHATHIYNFSYFCNRPCSSSLDQWSCSYCEVPTTWILPSDDCSEHHCNLWESVRSCVEISEWPIICTDVYSCSKYH